MVHPVIGEVVDKFLRDDPEGERTHRVLTRRGLTDEDARIEIAGVLLGCMLEAWRGQPDCLSASLEALRRGHTANELFPDLMGR